ncbi:MAG: YbhB/YbcL family Raf kinase inhibitor-like protein [Candidatus Odinarchaeota archaeon]
MRLLSNDFRHNQLLDSKFSLRGGNKSPHLKWEKPPPNTKSFAISCNDPDAPAGDWIHWLVVNIPKHITEIPQGGPVPGDQLQTDFGKIGYGGPSPPSGTHRYVFKIYALDVEKLKGINKKNFYEEMEDHTVMSAEIIGLYKSKK